ncbi:MAG: MinD/ParA family protein [Thermodesulfobacteriota bacterium]
MDQAEQLRIMMNKQTFISPDKFPRLISISSGKGGVGKTNIVVNLALALAKLRKKVLIFDADMGLANVNILLGLVCPYNIEHLLKREKKMEDILVAGPEGINILPASSGFLEIGRLPESQQHFLINELHQVMKAVDILLIDTAAGISANVVYFNLAAEETIVVLTPEATSLADAYALIKILFAEHGKKNFSILVNAARNSQEAEEVFKKITKVVHHFLGDLTLDYLGFIPFDSRIGEAVRQQRAVLDLFPQARCSRYFLEVARLLDKKKTVHVLAGRESLFWRPGQNFGFRGGKIGGEN